MTEFYFFPERPQHTLLHWYKSRAQSSKNHHSNIHTEYIIWTGLTHSQWDQYYTNISEEHKVSIASKEEQKKKFQEDLYRFCIFEDLLHNCGSTL